VLAGTCKSLFWFYTFAKNNGGGNNNYCSFKTCKATTKSSPATNQHPAFDRPCTDIFAHTHCIGFCSTGLLLHGHHVSRYTISALTLLVRQQEGHAACKEIPPTITTGSSLEAFGGTGPTWSNFQRNTPVKQKPKHTPRVTLSVLPGAKPTVLQH